MDNPKISAVMVLLLLLAACDSRNGGDAVP